MSTSPTANNSIATISKKICLIGDFGVGKTSLIRRFVDRQFSDQYLSTVGVKLSRKLLEFDPPASKLQLLIWDIEGSTKFKAIASSYLQGAAGAIVVGDVTRQETVDQLAEHVLRFLDINARSFVVMALNKADLVDETALATLLKGTALPDQPRVLATYSTSAKNGKDVDTLFQTLAQRMMAPDELSV